MTDNITPEPAALDLEAAADLMHSLDAIDVNAIIVSVAGEPGHPRQHHIALAPHQNFDVMAVVEVLRRDGYQLHFIEVAAEDGPRGFVISPPANQVETAEEVIPEPGSGIWVCTRCQHWSGAPTLTCDRCGMPRLQ